MFGLRSRSSLPLQTLPTMKALTTTGSMTAGSPTLVVADATGFNVNDTVIVEIGGEAGAGQRGTTGVGGYFTGTNVTSDATQYYTTGTVPKSLTTTIIGKSGNTLTLNANAVVDTTNATVWWDNFPGWDALDPGYDPILSDKQVQLPAGRYAFSKRLLYGAKRGLLQGNGTIIHSPRGCYPAYIFAAGASDTTIRDIEFQGNFKLQGFGIDFPGGWTYGVSGVLFENANRSRVTNIIAHDGPQKTVGFQQCSYCVAYSCHTTRTDPQAIYIQWDYQSSDSLANEFIDCTYDGPWLAKVFETFRSSRDRFIRCGGRNAMFSNNTAGGFTWIDCYTDIDALSRYSNNSINVLEPVFNANSNIDPSDPVAQQGGLIQDLRITFNGYVDANNNLLKAIIINEGNPKIRIIGTSYAKALIEGPDFIGGSLYGVHIGSTGAETYIEGYRVKGTANSATGSAQGGNINLDGSGSSVINCVADNILSGPTLSGNMTNTEYEALP